MSKCSIISRAANNTLLCLSNIYIYMSIYTGIADSDYTGRPFVIATYLSVR